MHRVLSSSLIFILWKGNGFDFWGLREGRGLKFRGEGVGDWFMRKALSNRYDLKTLCGDFQAIKGCVDRKIIRNPINGKHLIRQGP